MLDYHQQVRPARISLELRSSTRGNILCLGADEVRMEAQEQRFQVCPYGPQTFVPRFVSAYSARRGFLRCAGLINIMSGGSAARSYVSRCVMSRENANDFCICKTVSTRSVRRAMLNAVADMHEKRLLFTEIPI